MEVHLQRKNPVLAIATWRKWISFISLLLQNTDGEKSLAAVVMDTMDQEVPALRARVSEESFAVVALDFLGVLKNIK